MNAERDAHLVAEHVALFRVLAGEPVHRLVGLLDEDAIAVEHAELRRDIVSAVASHRFCERLPSLPRFADLACLRSATSSGSGASR